MNVISIERQKLRIGLTTSVLFDMSEADAIWRAEEGGELPRGSYKRYMLKNIDEPLPLRKKTFAWCKNMFLQEDVYFSLMSRNSPITGYRAVKTLVDHGLIPDTFVFTNGAPIAEYCPIYKLDCFISGNRTDVDKTQELGVAACFSDHVKPIEDIDVHKLVPQKDIEKLFTGPRLVPKIETCENVRTCFQQSVNKTSIAYDRDRVLHGSEDDEFFAENGLESYKNQQFALRDVPIEEGPHFEMYQKIVKYFLHAFIVHSITARGAESAIRDMYDEAKKGLDINGEKHCLGSSGVEKYEVQAEMTRRYGETPLIDDGSSHIEKSIENGFVGLLVPSKGSKIYLK